MSRRMPEPGPEGGAEVSPVDRLNVPRLPNPCDDVHQHADQDKQYANRQGETGGSLRQGGIGSDEFAKEETETRDHESDVNGQTFPPKNDRRGVAPAVPAVGASRQGQEAVDWRGLDEGREADGWDGNSRASFWR